MSQLLLEMGRMRGRFLLGCVSGGLQQNHSGLLLPSGPPHTKVRLAYIEQIDDEQQEHHPASLKASGPPGIWLKGSPLM